MIETPTGINSSPELQYASFWRRLGAFAIDCVIGGLFGEMVQLLPAPVAVPIIIAFLFGFQPVFESSRLQASPGKLAMGIIVTDINGNRPSYARALARYLSMNISFYGFLIGILMIFWTSKKQGLHDMIANCLVVRKQRKHHDVH